MDSERLQIAPNYLISALPQHRSNDALYIGFTLRKQHPEPHSTPPEKPSKTMAADECEMKHVTNTHFSWLIVQVETHHQSNAVKYLTVECGTENILVLHGFS